MTIFEMRQLARILKKAHDKSPTHTPVHNATLALFYLALALEDAAEEYDKSRKINDQ